MAHREMTHRSNRRARRLFKLAKDEDAAFARAWGFLSYTQIIAYLHDWKNPDNADDDDVDPGTALSNADIAVARGPTDHETLWSQATAQVFNHQVDVGIATYDTAIDFADGGGQATRLSLSTLKAERADALMFLGGPDNIRQVISEVSGLYPYRPSFLWTLGWAHYELGAYVDEQTNAAASRVYLERFPRPTAAIWKNLAATYVALGMMGEARSVAAQLRPYLPGDYDPNTYEDKWPHVRDRDMRLRRWKDHLIAALS
jgi:hypothetical protein